MAVAASPPRFLKRETVPHITTLVLTAALAATNMNMFLPSLPSMAVFFNASTAVMQLSVSAYLGCVAILQLVIGPLSDKYGRRPLMLAGMGCFLVGTAICTVAPTIEIFLFGRFVQSTVVAGFVLSRAIVRDLVGPDQAASMIGYVTMAMTLAPMLAPALGGYLDQEFGWQSNFVFMGVFGVIVLWIVYLDQGETNRSRGRGFYEQFKSYPELLRSRRFWGYVATTSFSSGCFFAFLGGGPFVADQVFGLSPATYGAYFGITALGYFIGNFLSGRFAARVGLNRMMLTGALVTVVGMSIPILITIFGTITALTFFAPIFFVGVGNGMTLPSGNAGVVSVRPKLAGSASGLGGAMQIGGGAALAALTGTIVSVETGGLPLLVVMFASAVCAVFATLYVIYVDRLVAREQAVSSHQTEKP